MCVLLFRYEYRIVSLMLGLIVENSWKLDEIEREETLQALAAIVPDPVLNGLFDLYTNKVENNHEETTSSKKKTIRYQYKEEMVCRMIAQNILQQGLKFHVADFITTWQEALPEGMKINVSLISPCLYDWFQLVSPYRKAICVALESWIESQVFRAFGH